MASIIFKASAEHGKTRVTLNPDNAAEKESFTLTGVASNAEQVAALCEAQGALVNVRGSAWRQGDVKGTPSKPVNGQDLAAHVRRLAGIKSKGKSKGAFDVAPDAAPAIDAVPVAN